MSLAVIHPLFLMIVQPVKFMSRERSVKPAAPFRRRPIYFPDFTIEMLKLDKERMHQVQETGWTREVAFRTTPNVTKVRLQQKGLLLPMQIDVGAESQLCTHAK